MRQSSYLAEEHNYASKLNKAVDEDDAMEIGKSSDLGTLYLVEKM